MTNSLQNKEIPKVGYFPNSFPRDPVEINNFNEHVLIGQIIEPLVENSPDGAIIPCVASAWKISSDNKIITFQIRRNLSFSNGRSVTAKDVKYSLDRQRLSPISQSKPYLDIIKSIDVVNDDLIIKLEKPYIAFFKALSRDHLGIVPEGWIFDANSDEPIIGSGPYRFLKINNIWYLKKNDNYRSFPQNGIELWEPIFADPKNLNYEKLQEPDLIPYVQFETDLLLKNLKSYNDYIKEDVNHFFQFSGWFYPSSKNYDKPENKKRIMIAIKKLLAYQQTKLGLREATGVIPEGIPGYLLKPILQTEATLKNVPKLEIRIAVNERQKSLVDDKNTIKQIEDDFNVKIYFETFFFTDWASLKKSKPDVVLFSYGGGFHDPEGFLVVISSFLGADLKTIFGDLYEDYLSASNLNDWSKRHEAYQSLNKSLVSRNVLAPGWKPVVRMFRRPNIIYSSQSISYTMKFTNFRLK